MTKLQWQDHLKSTGVHDYSKCPECNKRSATRKACARQKAIRQVYSDLGMIRVRGNLGGVYYE
jgi:tRNA(Ile2) C34 agmatinyltransferase TiaS